MNDKKDTDIFEYVFTRKELKRRMWSYVLMYVALRIVRVILLVSFGWYLGSVLAAILIFLSGVLFGAAIITVIYYRKSVRIEDLTTDL